MVLACFLGLCLWLICVLRPFVKRLRAFSRRTWFALTPPAKTSERASGWACRAFSNFSSKISQAVSWKEAAKLAF